MTIAEGVTPDRPITQSWRVHGAALVLLILFIMVAFRGAVLAAVEVWWTYPTYSHCFLIIPISLWLIWEKRTQLAQLQPVAELRVLWAVPALVLMWWIGEVSTINEARQFAVIGLVQVAIVAILGLRVYRQIWFPALYLFFLVPTGEYLIGPMQRFATLFTDGFLHLLHIPHHTEGTVIELTNGRFEIAEACAGLRFLIATVALGVLFAYMMFRRWYKIALFLLACVVVPLIGNGLRVVGIILLAHFTNNEYGAGADHLVYGWGFNVAILLLLFLLGSLIRDSFSDHAKITAEDQKSDTFQNVVTVFLAAALLMSLGPALALWNDSRGINFDAAGLTRPLHLRGWHEGAATGFWRPNYQGVDTSLAVSLSPEGGDLASAVDLYVGYYAQPRGGHLLTAHDNRLWNDKFWFLAASGRAKARLNGRDVQMLEYIVTSPAERRIIWASYWINGHFTTSLLAVKLFKIPAALLGHQGQALIAVSTIVSGTEDEARSRLSKAVAALGELPDRLNSANGRSNASGTSN